MAEKKCSVLLIIQARMSASRLPGKSLMDLDGMPLIQHTLMRAKKASGVDKVVLATSTSKADDPIEQLCDRIGVECFRGPEQDVLSRFLGAAKRYEPDLIVRICGDEPFLDIGILERCIAEHRTKKADYSTTVGAVPKGLDVEVVNYDVLRRVGKIAKDAIYREHVTNYILRNPRKFRILRPDFGKGLARSDIVLTVDTKDDFDFIKRLYLALKKEGRLSSPGLAGEIIRIIDSGKVKRKPILLLRADGSKEKGMGDIVSIMNIAENLNSDYEPIFVSKDYAEGIGFIKSKGYEVISLPVECTKEEELSMIRTLCDNRRIRHCIVELIPNDDDYMKELSRFLKTMMIDFFGNIKVYSDILVSWDLHAKGLKYHLMDKHALKLLGPTYAPMSSQMQECIKKKNEKRIRKIIISFGGGDPHDLSFDLLEATSELADKYDITFILGRGFKRSDDFLSKAREKKIDGKIRVVQSPANIHKLFAESDVVICGGGLTSFELCALRVPFIGISKISWEKRRLKNLESLQACRFIEADGQLKDNLLEALAKLSPVKARDRMSAKGKSIVDCKGASRIASMIRKRWK